ncbi:MAG: class I SAM-dependent methyltransferase [Phycisphaerae bacterium]|jgi:SAM-dependent methyltransferase
MKTFRALLSLVLPKWLAHDIHSFLFHPYWRKHIVKISNNSRVTSAGITCKDEKFSSRRPFKNLDKDRILNLFRKNNVHSVLDVGCGVGRLVKELSEEGFNACGININKLEIEQAQHPDIFLYDIQNSIENCPLKTKKFDAVVSIDCIEHLESPLIALKNINKLLNPNGLFIAYIPSARWIECDYHIIVYSPRQFRWLLNLAGFDLIAKKGRYRMSKNGVTYFARKIMEKGPVYPAVLE